MSNPIRIPLLNANEPETLLSNLYVKEGDLVYPGDLICMLETTKATEEITVETQGYIAGLKYKEGDRLIAGDVLCYLADDPDWKPAKNEESSSKKDDSDGLKISNPARALAVELGVDLAQFPQGQWITKEIVQSTANKNKQKMARLTIDPSPDNGLLIYGGGGHGKSLIELIRVMGDYEVVGIVDDGLEAGSEVLGVPVLGGNERLRDAKKAGIRYAVNAIGGIGNIQLRIRIFEQLVEAGFECPAVIHPTAFVEVSARLAYGVQIFPHAYVGSDCEIGFGVIVNTGAIISHDCNLGEYTNIAPGAMVAGGVETGTGVLMGMGATVNLGVKIGNYVRIGNSAVVKKDIPDNGIVRAGKTWPE
ncbi:MAG: NeuD/PglB/VioB family sugar acetyltransferase [Anaerolineales bacterium]|nr:NeuD/PglB/VioB family sugar acetyltransferase [Anaerolineales bacterium]